MTKVPASLQDTATKAIGFAGMKYDGTIVLRVRSKATESRNLIFCAPGDANYAQIFAHLDGLMPGQTDVVAAWQG